MWAGLAVGGCDITLAKAALIRQEQSLGKDPAVDYHLEAGVRGGLQRGRELWVVHYSTHSNSPGG